MGTRGASDMQDAGGDGARDDARAKPKGDKGKGRGRGGDDRVDRFAVDDGGSRSERAPWFDMDSQSDGKKPWTLLRRSEPSNAKSSPESSHAGSPTSTPAGGIAATSASSPSDRGTIRQRRPEAGSDAVQGNASDTKRDQRPRGSGGVDPSNDRTRGLGMDAGGDSGSRADKERRRFASDKQRDTTTHGSSAPMAHRGGHADNLDSYRSAKK